jgi:hypothetical protein
MTRRLPATRMPAPRVIHYVDAAAVPELVLRTDAQVAAQQRRQHELYLRWKTRQEEIAVQDRKVRRFWLGFGASIGLAVLLTLLILGWLAWTALGLGVLAVPLVIACTAGLAYGGHRCITVVQHWH